MLCMKPPDDFGAACCPELFDCVEVVPLFPILGAVLALFEAVLTGGCLLLGSILNPPEMVSGLTPLLPVA